MISIEDDNIENNKNQNRDQENTMNVLIDNEDYQPLSSSFHTEIKRPPYPSHTEEKKPPSDTPEQSNNDKE